LSGLLIGSVLAAACGGGGGGGSSSPAAPTGSPSTPAAASKPNFVLVIADDLDSHSVESMPKLRSLVTERGITFQNSFGANPVCCPARATYLRGQYSHNHGIWTNGRGTTTCADDFRRGGLEASTLVTWLQTAGYRTGMVGKYLNKYPGGAPDASETYVPPGWDDWYAVFSPVGSDAYYDYSINENSNVVFYGSRPTDYMTDVLAGKAVDFVRKGGKPFFLWFSTSAPHAPAIAADRHKFAHADKFIPKRSSFNEEDMSDKPRWYRENLPRMSASDVVSLEGLYKSRLDTLLAVDDAIERILQAVDALGQLQNTYVIFTSDNGFVLGYHRFPGGKDAPYEESIRVPLIVRGPSTPAGARVEHDVINIDLAPTIAELAGASAAGFVDGRSLASLLGASPPPLASWRQDVLSEHEPAGEGLPAWYMLRARDYKYVDYPTQSEFEYYDLATDPYEEASRHRSLDPARRQQLQTRLNQLTSCRGAGCRTNP
jgi:arylsulfatase A-like enzyme